MKILIIGLGAAGFAAAISARKQDRDAEIVVIDNKDYDLAHPCGVPFYLEGKVSKLKDLQHDLGLEAMRITKIKGVVKSIDTEKKEVTYENFSENKESYDKLIITAGARPFTPPIPGVENAYRALFIDDVIKIKEKFGKMKKAVIIGAGAIGLEEAVALKENGVEVNIIDIMDRALPNLIDSDMSKLLEEYLNEEGITMLFSKKIYKIEKDKVVLEDMELETDITILAAGVRSNLDLIENTPINKERGIIVDEEMKTSVDDIYAAGDLAQSVSLITGKPFSAQLATTAFKQGLIAGANAAGGSLKYKGSLGTFVSKIGNIEVAATGFSKDFAVNNGYDVIIGKAKAPIKPEWFPGSKKLTLKIIADKSGKILGAQAVGEEGAASRINVISTAIKAEMNIKDLLDIELAYCPAISDVKDVIHIAAELGARRVK